MAKRWHLVSHRLGWRDRITLVTPLWDSLGRGTLMNHFRFDKWDLIGISHVEDIWTGKSITPWKDLREEYQLAPTEVY